MHKHYNATFFRATGERLPVQKSYWERPLLRAEYKQRGELVLEDMPVHPTQWSKCDHHEMFGNGFLRSTTLIYKSGEYVAGGIRTKTSRETRTCFTTDATAIMGFGITEIYIFVSNMGSCMDVFTVI